ncbi:MAG: hypothetical protein ACRCTY_03795 [Candidatus Adiutrix sp.]
MLPFDLIRQNFQATNRAAEEFAKFKAGIAGTAPLPMEYVWWFLALIILIALFALTYTWVRSKNKRNILSGWFSITETDEISTIFNLALSRQGSFTIEIFDAQHPSTYKGHIWAINENQDLTLELSSPPNFSLNFDNFPAQVHLNFRQSLKSPMEHYQFSTRTIKIEYSKQGTFRVAHLSVSWPKNLISAQRRDFLRLEPIGQHALNCAFFPVPTEPVARMDNLEELATGAILDISIGGAQIAFGGIKKLNETQRFLGVIELPTTDLGLKLPQNTFYLLMQMMTQEVVGSALDSGQTLSANSDHSAIKTIVRTKFLGRYDFSEKTNFWHYTAFTATAFQDLSHWMHAYQRFQLKKERGLLPTPHERVNLYPPIAPKRPKEEE